MDRRLKKIAIATREEMESFARKHHHIGFGNESSEDLSCYCAIASYFLVMVGRKFGYRLMLIEGVAFERNIDPEDPYSCIKQLVNHCWVEYDSKIIDLSAKQFDSSLRKVHVANIGVNDYHPVYRNNRVRRNLKAEWPEDQSPYRYIKELRKRAKQVSMRIAA